MTTTLACPLCRSDKKMHKAKLLYGTPVCRKCLYKFANRRQIGYVLDWLLWLFISFWLGTMLGFLLGVMDVSDPVFKRINFFLAWFVFPLIFFCKDGFVGYSLGKLICGVRVVHIETLQPQGFLSSFKRNLILIIPFMPLVIAFLLNKGHRLGDGWAKSKVIWKKYANHPVFTGQLACEKCQYDLAGNVSGVCPECGTPISVVNQQRIGVVDSAPPFLVQ